MIVEKAYAKLNLSLNVLNKKNSYHMLKSVMVPINLYDTLYFEKNDKNIMEYIGPEIKNNSVLKAALLFQQTFNTKGATICLEKRIPIEAGFGGGSSDSSATLRGLNRLFELGLSLDELKPLADRLGSDNPFLLYNKAAICEGRGEKLTFIDAKFSFNVLVVKPSFGLLTKEVFSNISSAKERCIDELVLALKNNDYSLLNKAMFNDLLSPAIRLEPRLAKLINKISTFKVNVMMTGSGSALFIVSHNMELLEEIKTHLTDEYTGIFLIENTLS